MQNQEAQSEIVMNLNKICQLLDDLQDKRINLVKLIHECASLTVPHQVLKYQNISQQARDFQSALNEATNEFNNFYSAELQSK